jgi:hypothetical protein
MSSDWHPDFCPRNHPADGEHVSWPVVATTAQGDTIEICAVESTDRERGVRITCSTPVITMTYYEASVLGTTIDSMVEKAGWR